MLLNLAGSSLCFAGLALLFSIFSSSSNTYSDDSSIALLAILPFSPFFSSSLAFLDFISDLPLRIDDIVDIIIFYYPTATLRPASTVFGYRQPCLNTHRLKQARDRKYLETSRRTLGGTPKVTGKMSRLEGKDGKAIIRTLQPWITKRTLQAGDISLAQKALTKQKLKTSKGSDFSIGQVTSWLKSLRST